MQDGYVSPYPTSVRGRGVPWAAALQRFVTEGMPVAAVAHSYHVDALTDPRIRADRQFQRFSMIELNELHHQVATLGSLLRLQMGDPSAMRSLGINLAGFLANRRAGLEAASRFPPEVRNHPAVQAVMGLTEVSNRQVAENWPVLQQTLAATGSPTTGPMLVGPQE